MQKNWDEIQAEVTKRIHIEFVRQFDGKNRPFARAVGCDEKTIRKIFGEEKMNMTLELFFKICAALDVMPGEVLSSLSFSNKILP